MIDYTNDNTFLVLFAAMRTIINRLADERVSDAISIRDRFNGQHNLQGHARGVVPLALWLALHRPRLLATIRDNTDLDVAMTGDSPEARAEFWTEIQAAITELLQQRGGDRIRRGEAADTPETTSEIARVLSTLYGGNQTTGRGADTVLKRSLKLLAHVVPVPHD